MDSLVDKFSVFLAGLICLAIATPSQSQVTINQPRVFNDELTHVTAGIAAGDSSTISINVPAGLSGGGEVIDGENILIDIVVLNPLGAVQGSPTGVSLPFDTGIVYVDGTGNDVNIDLSAHNFTGLLTANNVIRFITTSATGTGLETIFVADDESLDETLALDSTPPTLLDFKVTATMAFATFSEPVDSDADASGAPNENVNDTDLGADAGQFDASDFQVNTTSTFAGTEVAPTLLTGEAYAGTTNNMIIFNRGASSTAVGGDYIRLRYDGAPGNSTNDLFDVVGNRGTSAVVQIQAIDELTAIAARFVSPVAPGATVVGALEVEFNNNLASPGSSVAYELQFDSTAMPSGFLVTLPVIDPMNPTTVVFDVTAPAFDGINFRGRSIETGQVFEILLMPGLPDAPQDLFRQTLTSSTLVSVDDAIECMAVPGTVTLLEPIDAATDAQTGPLLQWTTNGCVDDFEVTIRELDSQIVLFSDMILFVGNPTEIQLIPGTLDFDTEYEWTVTAINTAGQTLSTSTFRTRLPLPIRVNLTAPDGGDGLTWMTALNDLHEAIRAVELFSDGLGGEIWVAAGTYVPTERRNVFDPRSASFELCNGVELYGGFAGIELIRDDRDPDLNLTILSGDINGDDESSGLDGDNCYHVVRAVGVAACIDGFQIQSGFARSIFTNGEGGGVVVLDSTVALRNVRIVRCLADVRGGGIFTQNSFLELSSVRVTECLAPNDGASGVHADDSDLILDACSFEMNQSGGNLALASEASLTAPRSLHISSSDFLGYSESIRFNGLTSFVIESSRLENASIDGRDGVDSAILNSQFRSAQIWLRQMSAAALIQGCEFDLGIGKGQAVVLSGVDARIERCKFIAEIPRDSSIISANGGSANLMSIPELLIDNCTLSFGQAVSNQSFGFIDVRQIDAVIANCSFFSFSPGQSVLFVTSTDPTLVLNSIFWGPVNGYPSSSDLVLFSHCVLFTLEFQNAVKSVVADPLFVDPLGSDMIAGTQDDNLRLLSMSPAIDAGDNVAAEAIGFVTDLDGSPRFDDDPSTIDTGTGDAPIIDIGAFEYLPVALTCLGDANRDQVMNFSDITSVLSNWLNDYFPNTGMGDADGNGFVNFDDITTILGHWLEECP